MKNPTIATLLNLIPGLGYIYVGGKRKVFGILLIISLVVGTAAMATDPVLMEYYAEVEGMEYRMTDYVGLVSVLLGLAAFMYDGYVTANMHNERHGKKKSSR